MAPRVKLSLIVTGMHLSQEFGKTLQHIESDGMVVDAEVSMTPAEDSLSAMTRSIGQGIIGIAEALERIDPDGVVVLGDRVEAFAGAVSGAGLGRVVAHLHGGERTRGGLDESLRHAITKLAHLHFVATEESRRRVLQMGERAEHVFTVGAPGLDSVLSEPMMSQEELSRRLDFDTGRPYILVVQHPLTSEVEEAPRQMRETLEAVHSTGLPAVVIYPNADAGGRSMIEVVRSFPSMRAYPSLEHRVFLSALKHAAVLVGNTSCGIIEAPSLRVPVVNVGTRQAGRERSANVLDAGHDRKDIERALRRALEDAAFLAEVRSCVNPYGDGKSAPRIAEILESVQPGKDLIQKQIQT